jgi:hypothetical protein
MSKARKRRGLGLALALGVVTAFALAAPMTASAAPASAAAPAGAPCNISGQQVVSAGHGHHLSGIVVAGGKSTNTGSCHKPPPEPAFNGTPPLLFNGASGAASCIFSPCDNGAMLMTASTGPLVVVPIFWVPSGYSMSASYKSILTSYVSDVAKASGSTQNVYSVANEYTGSNGRIRYNVRLGPVLTDASPITSGCTLEASDESGIYADGSGYNSCVDDAQIQAEVDSVTAVSRLPHDLSHIYVLYLPKGVESCFLPGETSSVTGGQFCTINHQPTAAYCAYHSTGVNNAVYANMAFPIYASPVGFTCGSDARFPVLESPNGNPDADTEVSPTSHEIIEAITDPDTETGWYDSTGNEIGDDCAYIFGGTRGPAGGYFNQVISGGHFLTQEEFSNNVFTRSAGAVGCVQSQSDEH